METNKEKYIRFCEENDFVPIFSQPWWMDAVCVDGYWDVLLYEKNGEILGALPYYVKKRFGLSYITQPKLTQNNGVVIKYPKNQKYEKKLAYEKEVMTALIDQLEQLPITYYQQNFNYRYTNWLPFYWKGYRQTTHYTYQRIDLSILEDSIDRFNETKRKEIKRALKLNLQLGFDLSAEEFYRHHKESLKERGRKISYSFQLFQRIVNAAYEHNSGRIFYLYDKNNSILCTRLIIWDKYIAYSLMSSTYQKTKTSGASSLLFYECMKYVSTFLKIFDFEGSMNENIENSYRKFGTIQIPYFSIHKVLTNNPFLKLMFRLKGM